jgi:hypothetical protein
MTTLFKLLKKLFKVLFRILFFKTFFITPPYMRIIIGILAWTNLTFSLNYLFNLFKTFIYNYLNFNGLLFMT